LSDSHTTHKRLSTFSFNLPATPELYTLSLHDALPICRSAPRSRWRSNSCKVSSSRAAPADPMITACSAVLVRTLGSYKNHQTSRSEEHTSELQSQSNLVCRLLLEKKKKNKQYHINIVS